MFRLAILADDLTGALDSAEPFARTGASVLVATSVEAARTLPHASCDVIAVNVDSRQMQPQQAAQAIGQAWNHIAPWQPSHVFKKIDSRMKGNVGAELAALIASSGKAQAIIAPAIPAIGRFTRNGAVTGFGVEQPITIAALSCWQAEWGVMDCTSSKTMMEIAAQALAACDTAIATGASGLAEAMAAALAPDIAAAPPQHDRLASDETRMLLAIGSRDPITVEQIAALARSGVDPLPADGGDMLPCSAEQADVILLRPPSSDQRPDAVAQALAVRTLTLARRENIQTIVLSGGDTAAAFIRLAGIAHLAPLGALAQGMPAARGIARDGTAYTLITKSGGFGTPETLVNVFHKWRGLK